jgi:hypothetical protein
MPYMSLRCHGYLPRWAPKRVGDTRSFCGDLRRTFRRGRIRFVHPVVRFKAVRSFSRGVRLASKVRTFLSWPLVV